MDNSHYTCSKQSVQLLLVAFKILVYFTEFAVKSFKTDYKDSLLFIKYLYHMIVQLYDVSSVPWNSSKWHSSYIKKQVHTDMGKNVKTIVRIQL